MKTETLIKVIRVKCDFCKKNIPKNRVNVVGNLDFCDKKCLESYLKQNSLFGNEISKI